MAIFFSKGMNGLAVAAALISASCALAPSAMATTTVTYNVGTDPVPNPATGINAWYFTGAGSFSFASGLADGTYDQSILGTFSLNATWWWNVNAMVPPPPTITFPAAVWNFGLADISSFALVILGGTPVDLTYTLSQKIPTSSIPALASAPLAVGVDTTHGDPNVRFVVGNGDLAARFAGDINDARITESVPEPSAWIMMLVGFGAIGWAMRRRPTVTVSYA